MTSSNGFETSPFPPEDRERSPRTGWTRAHWERVADVLLEGVRPHASPCHAFVHVPDPRRSASGRQMEGLEGYARTFLLAALRLAGSDGQAPGDLAERYATGLAAGSDPSHAETWPPIRDVSQTIVEAAFVAVALHESRPWVWDRLSDAERSRAIGWLCGIHGRRVWHNNWVLFPVIVNAFLKSVGAPHRQDEMERYLDLVDSWYRSDGWYTDGPGANYDYYAGWAMHLYTLLWCRMDGDTNDPERTAEYRRRSRRFLEQYQCFFGSNGAPLYHGRSLVYRFAAVAPLWAGALLDATPLTPGETRRIASGALRYFLERGAVHDGLLTRGWHGSFPTMLQHYSGHGSQYWASKGFLGLLLPPAHPVWTAQEEAMLIERVDFQISMPAPGFLARGTRGDGIVRIASHRSDHYPLPPPPRSLLERVTTRALAVLRERTLRSSLGPADVHYRKLAYATHAAPEVGPPADALDVDSQLTLFGPDGHGSRRVRIHTIGVVDRFAASVFYPNEPDWSERVETVSVGLGAAEVRIHHVSTVRHHRVREGGFAIADAEKPEARVGNGWSLASRADGLTSFIGALHGFGAGDIQRFVGVNPFGYHSATPYLWSEPSERAEGVYISLVVLTGELFDPVKAMAGVRDLEVRGRQVLFSRPDGERFLVQLVSPEPTDLEIEGALIRKAVRFARFSPDGTAFTFPA